MFEAILIGAIVIIVACLIIGMIAILRDKDELNRAVLADYILYLSLIHISEPTRPAA